MIKVIAIFEKSLRALVMFAASTALVVLGAPSAYAQDASDFGWNKMQVAGTRPLLIILVQDQAIAPLVHDAAFYKERFAGPRTSTDRTLLAYYAEVSNGEFLWFPISVVGPIPMSFASTNEAAMRERVLSEAVSLGVVDLTAFDRNADGRIGPDELGVLVIIGWQIAQTTPAPVSFRAGRFDVNVFITGLGDQANLFLLAHELSHQLGTIDVYSGGNCLSNGLTLMSCALGGADDSQSVHLDPWHKMQLGWVKPRVFDMRVPGVALLEVPQAANSAGTENNESPALLFDASRGTSEYFLLEYRNPSAPGGVYDAQVASAGVAAWLIQQDPVSKALIKNGTKAMMVNQGAPSWIDGGNTLYTSPVPLKWSDGSETGVVVSQEPQGAASGILPIWWTGNQRCGAISASCAALETGSLLLLLN